MSIISLGHENYIPESNIEMILQINAKPIRDLISTANEEGKMLNVRHGRKGKTVVITCDHYVLISSLTPTAIASRLSETTLHIGNRNFIPLKNISMIVQVDSNPIKKRIEKARNTDRLVDATANKGSTSAIITKNGYVVISLLEARSLASRYKKATTEEEKHIE